MREIPLGGALVVMALMDWVVMEGYGNEEDLHVVAARGSASDVLAIIEAVKLSASVVSEERLAVCLNKKNEAKYTALHCAIFAR